MQDLSVQENKIKQVERNSLKDIASIAILRNIAEKDILPIYSTTSVFMI